MKAMTNMSRTELINGEQTIDITEERRTHRISPMCRCRDVSSRKDLIFLMKLLLDDLEKTDPVLRANIAQVVRECVLRNRQGHPDFSSLVLVTQRRVRDVVGEARWTRTAKSVFREKKRVRPVDSVNTAECPDPCCSLIL